MDSYCCGCRERLAELRGRFSFFEVDDEPLAAVDSQREIALREAECLAGGSHRLSKFFGSSNHIILPDQEDTPKK